MKRVLIGWEVGGGRGHVERLAPIVRDYLAAGWQVTAVLRNEALGRTLLEPLASGDHAGRLEVLPTPPFPLAPLPAEPAGSLAQVYCEMGFDKPAMVAGLVRAWEEILARLRPDLVVSEASPALNLAARGRVPLTVIGTGWSLPPAISPLPGLGARADMPPAALFEDRMVRCANAILGPHRAVASFAEILRGDRNFVFALRELDPYRAVRREQLSWTPEISLPPPNAERPRDRGLVYLPLGHPAIGVVLTAIAGADFPFVAFFGKAATRPYQNVDVRSEPIDIGAEMPRCRLLIHHGGTASATWALAWGVPQLCCPLDVEKQCNAAGVVAARAGGRFTQAIDPEALAKLIAATARLSFDPPRINLAASPAIGEGLPSSA